MPLSTSCKLYSTCMNILFKFNKIYQLHSSKGIIVTDVEE